MNRKPNKMIDVKEVRVGNLVKGHETKGNRFDVIGVNNIHITDFMSPIPLTEEWLLKFGKGETFTKPLGLVFKVGKLVFGTMNNYESIDLVFDGGTVNLISIKHVHQLQNLYFALTGEELDIN